MSEFDRDRCARRNRLAARRDGVEAMPLAVFAAAPIRPADHVRYSAGALPATVDEALTQINAGLPDGSTPLTADDVYIHYFEAANTNFISDRYMFMDASTLRNIAQDAATGVAFMNSHRDGGLSHPADLPMGRTFAGRYEEGRDGSKRALGGFYMLRGIQPNGQSGPSTDDLHRMIGGGTAFDVSVGLHSGDKLCDVCGAAIGYSEDDADPTTNRCPHVPGTHRKMTPDEKLAQTARGVKEGRASYSLVGAHLGEVSAVYDGAVPGAGFRKTLALARRHQLSRADVLEARQAYARLLTKGDLPMDDIVAAIEEGFSNAIRRLRRRDDGDLDAMFAALESAEEPPAPAALLVSHVKESPVDTDQLAQRQADLDRKEAEFARKAAEFAQQQQWAQAEQDVARLIHDNQVWPAQNLPNAEGQPELTATFAALLGAHPALYARVLARFAAAPAHGLTESVLPVIVQNPDQAKPPAPVAGFGPTRLRAAYEQGARPRRVKE